MNAVKLILLAFRN